MIQNVPDLEIFLLGHFQILVDGVPVDEQRWSRKKAKTLMKLLALAPHHKMHREQLIDVLWPEMDAGVALNNFHKIIHAARRVLEPGLAPGGASRFLVTQDLTVALTAPDLRIDVDEFERQAAEAVKSADVPALDAALALYRGDLLEEDVYEDWALLRREQVRLVYQRILERLAGKYETARDERAIEILNRLLLINRANEDAHRRLMRVYAAMGQRHLALAQYTACCDALKQELEVEPEAATVRLYESLLAGAAEAGPPVAPAVIPPVPVLPSSATPPESRRNLTLWIAISLLAIALTGALTAYILRDKSHGPAVPLLAILPLRVQPDGGPLADVADGITEELINSISRLNGVRVMARGTAFAYRGRTDSLQVGRELKVTNVLSGFVKQQGDTAWVGLELIDVSDGSRMWARKYSVPAANLTALQQLLIHEVTAALQIKWIGQQWEQQVRRGTEDAIAYRLYLSGRFQWNKRTAEGFRKSIEYYQQAIDRDPSYALAFAGLADSYGLLGWSDGLPRDYFPKAKAAATKALQLNESLAEAQTSLAMVSILYEWNWVAAEAQFRRAIELNGGYATAHHWYGVNLGAMLRFDESARELATALDLDPLSPIVNANSGYPAYYQRHFREAISIFNKALALNPSLPTVHEDLMNSYALKGDTAAAAKSAVQYLRATGQPELTAMVERANAAGGYRAAMSTWLQAVEDRVGKEFVSPIVPARLANAIGDRDKSLLWLERAYQIRSPQLIYLSADPQYDSLRSDPRFKNLVNRIGLPQR